MLNIKRPRCDYSIAQLVGVVESQSCSLSFMSYMPHAIHLNDLDFVPAQPLRSTGMKEICVGVSFFDGSEFASLFPVGSTLLYEQGKAASAEGAEELFACVRGVVRLHTGSEILCHLPESFGAGN